MYSLDKLRQLGENNEEFVIQMVNLFILEMPKSVSLLKSGYEENKISRIKAIAHKMKPSIQMFEIETLIAPIEYLNSIDENSPNLDEIEKQALFIIDVCNKITEQLKET